MSGKMRGKIQLVGLYFIAGVLIVPVCLYPGGYSNIASHNPISVRWNMPFLLVILILISFNQLDVKIIYSGGIALDILPQGAGKGQALAYLFKKFQAYGKQPLNTLVCGDSGNDAELFSTPKVYGVMVSNAQEELLQWYAENAKNNRDIFLASERCAAAIIQAIGYFGLGPNISLRDVSDPLDCEEETLIPVHEVLSFYLFYERWRRAEVQKSEQSIEKLRSVFYSPGIFVHPSGFEQPLHKYIDELERSYGDMQGTEFWVWLDKVSSARIGSDTWLVEFDKWELYGERRECCLTTVLMCSKPDEVPNANRLRWMHVHQTRRTIQE